MDRMLCRTDELSRLNGLLQQSRVVTVTGMDGIGKTRLVYEWCRTHRSRFVSVRPYRTSLGLVMAVAGELGIRASSDESAMSLAVLAALERFDGVLVLDNMEQLGAEAGPILDLWSSAGPILCTSRVPLELTSEQLLALGPLPLPAAVRLFRKRARTHLAADEDVASVVQALGRIPLAVELAAARADQASPSQLIALLSRDELGDHDPSLARVLETMLELLGEPTSRALAQLCIFQAPFSVEAAVAVLDGEGDPMQHLRRLHQSSMLTHSHGTTEVLLQVPAPIADFVRSHHPTTTAAEVRYAVTVLEHAANVATALNGPNRARAVARMGRSVADILMAIEIALREAPAALDRIQSVRQFLALYLPVRELISVHEALRAAYPALSAPLVAELASFHASALRRDQRAGYALEMLAGVQVADDPVARAILSSAEGYESALSSPDGHGLDQCREAAEALDRLHGTLAIRARAWLKYGSAALEHQRVEAARVALQRALLLAQQAEDGPGEAIVLCQLATLESRVEPRACQELLLEAIRIAERLGGEQSVRGMVLANAVLVRGFLGDHLGVRELIGPAIRSAEANGDSELVLRLRVAGAAALTLPHPDGAALALETLRDGVSPDSDAFALLCTAQGYLAHQAGRLQEARLAYQPTLDSHHAVARTARVLDQLAALELRAASPHPSDLGEFEALGGVAEQLWARGRAQPEIEEVVARLPNTREGVWVRRIVQRCPPQRVTLQIAPDGSWFVLGYTRIPLGRRPAHRRVLMALAQAREGRNPTVTVDSLVQAGWPEKPSPAASGKKRLHTTVYDLRQLGLGELLQTTGDGYQLDPSVPLVSDPEKIQPD